MNASHVPLLEPLKTALALSASHGITRIADVTGMDRINIPCVNVARPDAAVGNLTMSAGKGLTAEEATLRALMESYERYYSEQSHSYLPLNPPVPSDVRKIQTWELNPNWIHFRRRQHEIDLDYVEATGLSTDDRYLVPAVAVYTPCTLTGHEMFGGASHGLAAGFDRDSATMRALLEVAEREAYSFGIIAGQGNEVQILTLPERLKVLADRYERADISVRLFELHNTLQIPTYFAIGVDQGNPSPTMVCGGVASDLDSDVAIEKSLLELAQTRTSIITGSREDFALSDWNDRKNDSYSKIVRQATKWMNQFSLKTYKAEQQYEETTVEAVVKRFLEAGFQEPVVAFHTEAGSAIQVARAIVPGAEVCGDDIYRIGPRLASKLSHH